ncbi:hypothetical protein H310_14071 [Aphanomyces invadans]|uniref:Uncharacterized protein n=1 Tax=Aphanomyces invadans TaxID=157072 RepID=A0A024TBQ4_9STRA|nr:hypothetical protein H310_14071 [Aphanomyces invadans]ETV91404.1 hypothetical protein H310_14071 [Aphanomyces invadans]|eukprot:XP_008880032.1 hypothetical protein H310_14071 [Aphanomyces invadans]
MSTQRNKELPTLGGQGRLVVTNFTDDLVHLMRNTHQPTWVDQHLGEKALSTLDSSACANALVTVKDFLSEFLASPN